MLDAPSLPPRTIMERVIRFGLDNRLIVLMAIGLVAAWGYRVMPFQTRQEIIPRDPVAVDAIPDIGENQQVVFAEWAGRSPQDVENQLTYPLSTSLQGVAGVKTIRSTSMFGFAVVFVIFHDEYDFFWCRSRLLEKLSTVSSIVPEGVTPRLGPEATALGQVFWYTLEGSHGGFDLAELRSIQDWYVRQSLQGVDGVAEVAAVGGHVREYQVDVDPDALRAYGVTLPDVLEALRRSNIDVGAATVEWNGVEYLVRGKGFIKSLADVENTVVRVEANVPILVSSIARVQAGPALRRGVLDKGGAEAVGGVVLVRYGTNPLEVIERLKSQIAQIAPGLPSRTLPDGTTSQVQIVPFYDRTILIHETIDTLADALWEQILVTTFVMLLFLRHVRSCLVISLTMPFAVLICFIIMKITGVESNLMSLAGIAIAIGTMDDMGIILTENIVRHIEEQEAGRAPVKPILEVVYEASREVGSAVTTAILMTVVAFLPVFALEGAEGKLFGPLAYTKSFCLLGSLVAAIFLLPTLAAVLFARPGRRRGVFDWLVPLTSIGLGVVLALAANWYWAGAAAVVYGVYILVDRRVPIGGRNAWNWITSLTVMAAVILLLTQHWMPLGPGAGFGRNLVIVLGINVIWATVRLVFIDFYPWLLRFFLAHKLLFLSIPMLVIVLGFMTWLGFSRTFAFLPEPKTDGGALKETYRSVWTAADEKFPGIGREFMPPLDEGSFLYMPTLMPHAGIGVGIEVLAAQDRAISAIPEVDMVVGKIGRAETAIDPAPLSMIETLINYKSEYKQDPVTHELLVDENRRPIRQWREHIKTPADIWREIEKAAAYPGVTGAPPLQPIETRRIMLQSGIRASMAVKISGLTLDQIEGVGFRIADVIRNTPGVNPAFVVPDRVNGKPYLEIEVDRERTARYGVNVADVLETIEIALGGMPATTTVEGRQRYAVRVRYLRELRDNVEAIERISITGSQGEAIPLREVAEIKYVRGPEEIKSEDGFLVSYVLFDKLPGFAEVDVVEQADRLLKSHIASGDLQIPEGVHFRFAGNYENQVRFQQRLNIILPLSLFLLFLLVYMEFRSVPISAIIFSGIPVAWAGGFIGLWLIAQPWFFNFDVFGVSIRELMHFKQYNLSAAVWVGFIALFSVTTDDGVVLATYLMQAFDRRRPKSISEIRDTVAVAGMQRVRPCLMTSATTVLSLMPVLTSTGRGADVMIAIALPTVGGLTIELLSLFVLPVCYSGLKEWQWRFAGISNAE
jgi:copper/silver efflux system protein